MLHFWIRILLLFYKFFLRNVYCILQIDQKLTLDKSTSLFVSNFASNGEKFVNNFATAMIKMGKIGLLIGNEGEVRKNCRVFNKLN